MKISRSIDLPVREFIDMDHRWRGPDNGLVWCWESGRLLANENPKLAQQARDGELMTLVWRGGVQQDFKSKTKLGTLNYLAQWQGLAGKDLEIDTDISITLTCSVTGARITYSKDDWKRELPE